MLSEFRKRIQASFARAVPARDSLLLRTTALQALNGVECHLETLRAHWVTELGFLRKGARNGAHVIATHQDTERTMTIAVP